ncbi:MAG: cytochrome P450 [Chlamydiae bacterium]|nr:cytochrome P450 [Chlamydiota bacterium]MBI3265930.1 cytochrome P450 [Chlamydiota bacterium]
MSNPKFPPGPKFLFPGSGLIKLLRDPISFLMKSVTKYGDLIHFKAGPRHVFFTNHPEQIKDILVTHQKNFIKGEALERTKQLLGEGLLTSEGELHLKQRRLIQPILHRQNIERYASIMVEYGVRIREAWRNASILDMSQEMARLTLLVVGKTLFNRDVDQEAKEVGEAMTTLVNAFRMMLLPISDLLEKLPLPGIHKALKARETLDKIIQKMIEERRKERHDSWDLLSLLLSAQENGEGMNDQQVRDEAMTLFLAGHETTANALTWTWYLLSQNPQAEAKLHQELKEVLGDRLPTYEDMEKLKYLYMVFSESMRLYPPAWAIGRRAIDECELGGYRVPRGSIVAMSPFVIHHSEKYYPDSWRFDPMRWTPEAQAQRPKFAYFPFGAGGRVCIGEHFAWMEEILLMATLAQKWKMRLAPGHPIGLQPGITLRPKYGMKMILEKR